jgi:hypothetical protein
MGWSGMVAALPCLLRASTIQFHLVILVPSWFLRDG